MRGSQRLNYKARVLMSLQDVSEAFPDYTMSEILYSALKGLAKRNNASLSWLYKIPDKVLSTAIDNVIIEEKD